MAISFNIFRDGAISSKLPLSLETISLVVLPELSRLVGVVRLKTTRMAKKCHNVL